MVYFLHLLILVGIFSILSISLNLLVGYTGILSVAHAAFYAVGAYIAALLALRLNTPFLLNIVLAVLGSSMIGCVVGFPSLRVKDDYFVIATFGFQIITFSLLNNLITVTGGPFGLVGIPLPNIFGVVISGHWAFFAFSTVLVLATYFVANRIVSAPFGRVLKSLREDEVFTMSAGKNVTAFKIIVFMVSAGLASLAGVLFATYITYIDPTSFTVMESIFIISVVIIGGASNLKGSILGAAVMVLLPEALRFLGMPNSVAANVRQIIYGLLLVVFMLWRPRGFMGEFSFGKK